MPSVSQLAKQSVPITYEVTNHEKIAIYYIFLDDKDKACSDMFLNLILVLFNLAEAKVQYMLNVLLFLPKSFLEVCCALNCLVCYKDITGACM